MGIDPSVVLNLSQVLHVHAITQQFPDDRERVLHDSRRADWFTGDLLDGNRVGPA